MFNEACDRRFQSISQVVHFFLESKVSINSAYFRRIDRQLGIVKEEDTVPPRQSLSYKHFKEVTMPNNTPPVPEEQAQLARDTAAALAVSQYETLRAAHKAGTYPSRRRGIMLQVLKELPIDAGRHNLKKLRDSIRNAIDIQMKKLGTVVRKRKEFWKRQAQQKEAEPGEQSETSEQTDQELRPFDEDLM